MSRFRIDSKELAQYTHSNVLGLYPLHYFHIHVTCLCVVITVSFFMDKFFISYNQIHETIGKIAEEIRQDGYEFDFMIAIGTGGFIPARILKSFIDRPILTVGIAYYDLDDNRMEAPIVNQWLDDPVNQVKGRKILLVDEVDDTRNTIGFCVERLLRHDPEEIAVVVLHDKEKPKAREIFPTVRRYYRGEKLKNIWICYPWDAQDIGKHDTKTPN